MIKNILFDIGGPIDKETLMDQLIDEQIIKSFKFFGINISDKKYKEIHDKLLLSFSKNLYKDIIWLLSNKNIKLSSKIEKQFYDNEKERNKKRDFFEPQKDIFKILRSLKNKKYVLGIVANQPVSSIKIMKQIGLLDFFSNKYVSDSVNLYKPDENFFLHVCKNINANPFESIMIGDRIDNDIVPAKKLGMKTIRLITGRYKIQNPRNNSEEADFNITNINQIEKIVESYE
ncbi:MAG: HAD family hydrolase [Dehalococcoidia bacterium]